MIKQFRKIKKQPGGLDSPRNTKHSISTVRTVSSGDNGEVDNILQSPKKVIKALYNYQPQGPKELPFSKGDFFHVVNNEENEELEKKGWYEATNPMTNAIGMVPISYFESFQRSRPKVTQEISPRQNGSRVSSRNSNQSIYAVTMFEFKAERDDELDILAGENLIICAHHDYEWFIAKPINRLGGPGLVPVLYVKIVNLLDPFLPVEVHEESRKLIDHFAIPTVDQWKNQTAKYQASTIALGSVSSHQQPSSHNTQYFQSERLTLDSEKNTPIPPNVVILEASVDSYQLDHKRYQYLVIAKLSNGKIRYLYRYYQDFYDLQVKLLELFPWEAGKIENKRIIPSIPGPLINVNDSISKLRREKLDHYLKNLIALPSYISKCEDVLRLFDVVENGFDRESTDPSVKKERRYLKPISHQSNYQQDRMSQYSNINSSGLYRQPSTPTSSDSILHRSLSSSSANLINNLSNSGAGNDPLNQPLKSNAQNNGSFSSTNLENKQPKVKTKFYYEDDIFVLLLPVSLRLQDLKTKLARRLSLYDVANFNPSENVHLYLKDEYEEFISEHNIVNENFSEEDLFNLTKLEITTNEAFHSVLTEKCKIKIVVQ